jgi:hypothetical protein
MGILSFKEKPIVALLYFISGVWVPIILLIRKSEILLYVLSFIALISVSLYWITMIINNSNSASLLIGYWIWYFSNLGIIVCQILKYHSKI